MSDRVVAGQLAYDFLKRRFDGELVNADLVADRHRELTNLKPLLREAERAHRHYLSMTIENYDLIGLIGRGGFGEVFLAQSTQAGYHRALKVVSRQQFSELSGIKEYMTRIPEHQHLVTVHHVAEAGKQYFYYTMPHADNLHKGGGRPAKYLPTTLAACLNRWRGNGGLTPGVEPLPPLDQVAALGCAVADGLKRLHDDDLVHRDVKPGNILCISGTWKLGDVGLLVSLKGPVTDAGTQVYWPPEGPTKDPKKADQYALGLTLFQAATGYEAHVAAAAVRDRRPQPGPKAAEPLFDLIWKACAEKPGDRFESAGQLLNELVTLRERLANASSADTSQSWVFRLFNRKKKR